MQFDTIPTNLRIPFMAVEFNSSQAQQGASLLTYKALLIGQKLAAGTAVADVPVRCTSVEQAIILGGRGSMLHREALGWFAVNQSTELWLGPLADNGAGVAATGTIVFTSPATASGTIAFYFGGERITVGVTAGDATTVLATNTAAAITAALDLPVTASAGASTVTVLFRHKGTAGNAYDMRHSFNAGEVLPAGVALTITALATGATNPVLTNLIAAIADMWFQIMPHPYTDATNLGAIEAELALRNGPMRQQQGFAITSTSGNFAGHTSLGGGRNSPHSEIWAQPGQAILTPPFEFAAEAAGLIAKYGAADPARPFQTLAFQRAIAPAETDQWSSDERNLMLFDGISTTKRVVGGGVQLERAITTYQVSPSGADDVAYLDATTMLTLLYLRYSFRVWILTRYPRHKLADDGARFAAGQAVITPKLGKAEAINWFREMELLGLVENFEQFKRDLKCERNQLNRNQLDWYLPPDLMNQFIVGAAQIGFRL